MFVTFFARLFVGLVGVVTVAVQAAEQGIQFKQAHSNDLLAPATSENPVFWSNFKTEFDHSANDQFTDRFRSFSAMTWSLESAARNPADLALSSSTSARHAFSGAMTSGFREATIDLPLLLWFAERHEFLADFFRSSVGSLGEQEVAPLDLSYRFVERSWWKRLAESGEVLYGLCPFQANPYAFLSTGIKDGDTVIALMHVRYHYQKFANHSFELALSVPLVRGFTVDFGTSYQFGPHDSEKTLAVKLFKELRCGGVVQVGLKARNSPGLFAGIAFPW